MESRQRNESLTGAKSESPLEGKYLTFSLASERYGLAIMRVQEIISVPRITAVPRAPKYIKGVINLRGKIIPIIDLRLKFGMPPTVYDEKTCVVVLDVSIDNHNVPIGVIVDTVHEVVSCDSRHLEPTPDYGNNMNTQFISGIAKTQTDEVVILIDIDHALGELEDHMGSTSESNMNGFKEV